MGRTLREQSLAGTFPKLPEKHVSRKEQGLKSIFVKVDAQTRDDVYQLCLQQGLKFYQVVEWGMKAFLQQAALVKPSSLAERAAHAGDAASKTSSG